MIVDKFWPSTTFIECDLSLTALVVGTSKISLTSLSISGTNRFWDAFDDEMLLLFLLF